MNKKIYLEDEVINIDRDTTINVILLPNDGDVDHPENNDHMIDHTWETLSDNTGGKVKSIHDNLQESIVEEKPSFISRVIHKIIERLTFIVSGSVNYIHVHDDRAPELPSQSISSHDYLKGWTTDDVEKVIGKHKLEVVDSVIENPLEFVKSINEESEIDMKLYDRWIDKDSDEETKKEKSIDILKAKINEELFQGLGEASMCWSETPKGAFNASRAKAIGEEILVTINEAIEDVPNAVRVLTEALKNDEGYYISYQASIAMAFVDELHRNGINLTNKDLGENELDIANKAAKSFLDMWISK